MLNRPFCRRLTLLNDPSGTRRASGGRCHAVCFLPPAAQGERRGQSFNLAVIDVGNGNTEGAPEMRNERCLPSRVRPIQTEKGK